MDKWSRKFEKCINCETTAINHVAKGLCRKCYSLNTEEEHKPNKKQKRGVADDFLTKEKLYELYIKQLMSLSDIGKLAGCSRVNVHYKLIKYGINTRSKSDARTLALDKGKVRTVRIDEQGNEKEIIFQKIRYNEHFFKKWSNEMAYVLGLIYTDGNLHIRKTASGYETGILTFGQKDKELVEKFLKLMDCDAIIRLKERREFENTTSGELYYFSIGNNDLANDLKKLGLTPNKSLDMVFPEIPKIYLRHFIRGLFDGDGSVYIDNKTIRVKLLSGSLRFIEQLNQIMVENGFDSRKIDTSHVLSEDKPRAYYICYSSKISVHQFYNFIYKSVEDHIYYSRKKNIFIDNITLLNYK
jgi:intein-encoded DNA endonuclease-like protein